MVWVAGVGLLCLAYLLGSIPTGYLVARAVKGIDIRQYGSGNTGATNVLRVVGKWAALGVFAIDMLKGSSAVLLMGWLLPPGPGAAWWIMGAGLLALVGHSRSIWLNWTGGKSAATGFGVLLAMAWPVAIGAIAVFAGVLAIARMVSLGSILAALAAVVLMVATGQPLPYGLLALLGSIYVILRHRTNIERILAGTEPRLGSQGKTPPFQSSGHSANR